MRISDWSSDVCSSDLARLDVRTRQSEHGPVQIGILAAGELRVESGPELQQGGDAPVDGDLARAWRQRAADQLQERGLAGAVSPDDADRLAPMDVEVQCAQCQIGRASCRERVCQYV